MNARIHSVRLVGALAGLALVAIFVPITTVVAAGTYADFLAALAKRESGDRSNPNGNPLSVNAYGYVGLYQMGEAALIDAGYYNADGTARNDWSGTWTGRNGVNSLNDFLSDPNKQNKAITDFHQKLRGYIQSAGLDAYIGKTINGILITESGMIAGAHLVGIGGLKTFLSSNGKNVPSDALGTPITEYLETFGSFSISAIAPPYTGAPPITGSGTTIPSTHIPGPPGGLSVPPATAFSSASGHTPADVRVAVGMVLTTFLFLWVVWTSVSHFDAWRKGRVTIGAMQADLVRALVVLSVLMVVTL